MNPKNNARFKSAMQSILVGTTISFLTLALQATLDWLHGVDVPTVVGVGSALGHYIKELHHLS